MRIHGIFLPRDGRGKEVKLIDWENWSIDTATDDLAYMMAMLWYPDRRRRMEGSLLDLYHATLLGGPCLRLQSPSPERRLSNLSALAYHTSHMASHEQHPSPGLVEQPRAHHAGG
jgi:Ecdysteroid kinase-like family